MVLPAKHFYMIRHGQTEANAAHIMAGSLDSPLTTLGRDQARIARDIVKCLDIKPRVIIHSHLSRARDTAYIINEALNAPIHEDSDLAEFHAGDWEGRPYDECRELLTGWPTPPNGESYELFAQRIRRGKENALNTHDAPVLIVCHGGVFRGLGKLYGLNTPGVFKNCHLYEFLPNPQDQKFPWDVWSHQAENGYSREKNMVFHDSEPYMTTS